MKFASRHTTHVLSFHCESLPTKARNTQANPTLVIILMASGDCLRLGPLLPLLSASIDLAILKSLLYHSDFDKAVHQCREKKE